MVRRAALCSRAHPGNAVSCLREKVAECLWVFFALLYISISKKLFWQFNENFLPFNKTYLGGSVEQACLNTVTDAGLLQPVDTPHTASVPAADGYV